MQSIDTEQEFTSKPGFTRVAIAPIETATGAVKITTLWCLPSGLCEKNEIINHFTQ